MTIVWNIICTVELLLWIVMAVSVGYVLFFSLASLLPQGRRRGGTKPSTAPQATFLVLIPAYHEDNVIRSTVETFLKQDYPRDRYRLVVISDHESDETNAWLNSQPVTLLTPQFDRSSKARALQYAVHSLHEPCAMDYVVILDADNIVAHDFLSRLDTVCQQSYRAIQCHRTAKNADNDIAALDGLSEEINNSIFRRGHNRVGLSSALIGSGMCFDYNWFIDNVDSLDSAVEDRELEALLLREGIYIHYAEDILVMDEKVSTGDNFQRQRLRWMSGQVQALVRMMAYVPRAVVTGNINYLDKTLQQSLIPRSILLLSVPFFCIVTTLLHLSPAKWWILLAALLLGILIAIPVPLRSRALLGKVLTLIQMAWRMLKNVFHINTNNKDFTHTTHGA